MLQTRQTNVVVPVPDVTVLVLCATAGKVIITIIIALLPKVNGDHFLGKLFLYKGFKNLIFQKTKWFIK